MALKLIDLTTPQPGGKFGDPTKTAWEKVNDNTQEITQLLESTSAETEAVQQQIVLISEQLDEGLQKVSSTAAILFTPSEAVPYAGGIQVPSANFSVSYQGQIYTPNFGKFPFTTEPVFNPVLWKKLEGITSLAFRDISGKGLARLEVSNTGEAHRSSPMMVSMKRTAVFNLSNANPSVPIAWNDRRYDTAAMWSSSENTRLTVPAGASGFWRFKAAVEFPATASAVGTREVIIRRLGSTIIKRVSVPANSGGRTQVVDVDTGPIAAYQGHWFEVLYYQDSGVTLVGEFAQTSFMGERTGDFRGRWEGVSFSSDFSYQNGWGKYTRAGGTIIEPTGLSIDADPVNPSLACGKIRTTKYNDSVQYPRVQAQTNSFIGLNDDIYVGLSIFIPLDTHQRLLAAGHGINIHEIYGPPFGTKSPNIIQYNPQIGLNVNAYIDGEDVKVWQLAPEQCVGKWIDIVHRVRLSSDPAVGFHEVWCDKGDGSFAVQQTLNNGNTRFNLATVLAGVNNGGNNFSSLKVSWAADTPLQEATVYIGEHRVGTDLYVRTDRSSYNAAY